MVLSSKRRLSVCIGCDKIRGHSSEVIVLVNVVVVRVVVALVGTVVMPVVVVLEGIVAMVFCSSEVTGSMELEIKSVIIET